MLRLVKITLAPACAKARAVSTPIPELPPIKPGQSWAWVALYARLCQDAAHGLPVMTAVLPVRSAPLRACEAVVPGPSAMMYKLVRIDRASGE